MTTHAIPQVAGSTDRHGALPARVRRIAVEAGRLVVERRGISRYVRALVPRMAAARPDLVFSLHAHEADHPATADWVAGHSVLHGRVVVRSLDELELPDADVVWFPWNVARVVP
ncbi:MAG: hypothetical protein U9Q74_12055, partial [Gemmatimonadota bacterium]|nr:hypothetical protein [Gemmatimonadota bacterium]